MEKETVLEIEFIPVWDKWAWRITKQDEDVFKRGIFKDTNLRVFSCTSPQFNSGDNRFFIRGSNKNLDDNVELCTNKEKTLIEEKVKAINEKYGKSKRWRAIEGEWYYSINISGEIIRIQDKRRIFDDDNYNFSNYFQTEEQAEKARKLQKKAYQEVWKHG